MTVPSLSRKCDRFMTENEQTVLLWISGKPKGFQVVGDGKKVMSSPQKLAMIGSRCIGATSLPYLKSRIATCQSQTPQQLFFVGHLLNEAHDVHGISPKYASALPIVHFFHKSIAKTKCGVERASFASPAPVLCNAQVTQTTYTGSLGLGVAFQLNQDSRIYVNTWIALLR